MKLFALLTGILLFARLFDRVSGSSEFVDLVTGETKKEYTARIKAKS